MKDALAIFVLTLAAYTLTASGHLYSPDEEILYRVTRSIAEEGNLAIEPLAGFATKKGTDGREYAQYGIMQPILAVPFYLAGKASAGRANDTQWQTIYGIDDRAPEGAYGFKPVAAELAPRFACSFFNIFIGAMTAAALSLLVRQLGVGRAAGWMAVSLYAFGSLAWPHSRPFFTESCASFFMVLAWLFALRSLQGRMTPFMILSGLAAGAAALTRMDSALLYPGLAMVMLGPVLVGAREHRPAIHPYVSFCVPAILCGGVLLVLNKLHFGGLFSTGYSDQPEGVHFSTPLLAGLYGFLFSVGKGLFFFSPGLAIALPGLRLVGFRGRWLGAGLLLSIALPLLIQSKWQNWAGGWCWGPRHIFMIHPFLALPAALWLEERWGSFARIAAYCALTAGIAVQLLGTSQSFMDFHWTFYRNHGRQNFRVLYDGFDEAYWSMYYKLQARPPRGARVHTTLDETAPPSGDWGEARLSAMPAPIQHSVYMPNASVWTGYPQMWREYRTLDNLWYRLISNR